MPDPHHEKLKHVLWLIANVMFIGFGVFILVAMRHSVTIGLGLGFLIPGAVGLTQQLCRVWKSR